MEDVIILDTGVLIDFLADRESAGEVERTLSGGKGAVSVVTVYELFRGANSKVHIHQRAQLLCFVHKIDLTEQIARVAGQIYTDLKERGNLIANEDILIAATSLYHTIPVFTTNEKHFSRVPRLQLHTA